VQNARIVQPRKRKTPLLEYVKLDSDEEGKQIQSFITHGKSQSASE
jgi:hypothetical protein